jgi:hypothetical protein
MSNGSPHAFGVAQVCAFELIKDKLPLPKLIAKELMLFPAPLIPWVNTYKTPEGREDELPQLSKNILRAHTAMSATTTPNFFDICSPKGSPIGAFAYRGSSPLPVRGLSAASRH